MWFERDMTECVESGKYIPSKVWWSQNIYSFLILKKPKELVAGLMKFPVA